MSTEIRHYRERITPQMAKDWLARNTKNRALRPNLVDHLAKVILFGEWQVNGDAIRFDTNGKLLDGQHRLQAIVAADKAVESFVIEGLPPKTQETMDMGRKRQISDVLSLRGESQPIHLAAVITMMWKFENGRMWHGNNSRPTLGQALKVLDEHPELRDAIRHGSNFHNKVQIPTTVIATSWALFNAIDETDCRDFWTAVTTSFHLDGTPHMADSPTYALQRYAQRNATGRNRVSSIHMMGIVIKAWNHYRQGNRIAHLRFNPGGSNAEEFPQPV